jgi:signal peptidase I
MDFALILFTALLVTGGIWLLDRLFRRPQAENIQTSGPDEVLVARKEPWLVEYAKAFFPVILLVFVLRSFVVEPFRIPSGSMLPSLQVGDFILVNKFSYGLRLPIINKKIVEMSLPQRGDVMVFRFPHDESINFIKRVVGLPGDTVEYRNKQLYINGAQMLRQRVGTYPFEEAGRRHIVANHFSEALGDSKHDILTDPGKRTTGMSFTVPEGHYFVMGDNRDYSNDSRFWGFVPERNVIGRAFFIWFSWNVSSGGGIDWERIGNTIR